MTSGMPYTDPSAPPFPQESYFIHGVLLRRILGWIIDLVVIAVLLFFLWWAMLLFGLLTLGFGFGVMALLPFVPFCYHLLSLLSRATATPGQRMAGLTVRRDEDLGPPTGLQALVFTVVFYLTLATSGLLLIVALFTSRHRTLHDLASGLVVVRTRAMEALTQPAGLWNMGGGSSRP
ncbi:MAG TPA: RDD family protein [Acetobacteraceae bacterium]|nr:RDD family protein [Acetobacteraceae bacterium]